MNYYYLDESGQPVGPVSEAALRALYKAGVISFTTEIAEAGSEEWKRYASMFGFTNGPSEPKIVAPTVPPPVVRAELPASPPLRKAKEVPVNLNIGGGFRMVGCFVAVTVAVLGVTARYYRMPFMPAQQLATAASKLSEVAMPGKAGDAGKIQNGQGAQATKTDGAKDEKNPSGSAKGPEKVDSMAEWYEFGFNQGLEVKRLYDALAKPLIPSKPQLMELMLNLDQSSSNLTPDELEVGFEGYRDAITGVKATRTVAASQKKSVLPTRLRGYRQFGGAGNEIARASSDQLERTLAATVMIIELADLQVLGEGSGFFIGPGVLVTNRHVVSEGNNFKVRMPNKAIVPGKVIAVSKSYDVALMIVPTTQHGILRLSAGHSVRVGDQAAAFGFPQAFVIAKWDGGPDVMATVLNLEATTTFGYISALNRKFQNMDCFQIDLTINHGNSGGPMTNSEGSVIGISTFGLASEEAERTNFAIKISAVLPFIQAYCGFPLEVDD